MKNISDLHDALAAVAPISGVSIGAVDDKSTWRVDYLQGATSKQKAAAKSIIQGFDAEPGIADPIADAKADIADMIAKGDTSGAIERLLTVI